MMALTRKKRHQIISSGRVFHPKAKAELYGKIKYHKRRMQYHQSEIDDIEDLLRQSEANFALTNNKNGI